MNKEAIKKAQEYLEGDNSNPAFKHQMKVAIDTLKMNDKMAAVMGGMSKPEAKAFLRRAGWSENKIKRLELGQTKKSAQEAKEKKKKKVKCPKCGSMVWDTATIDQRLNKCWKCGTKFDSPEENTQESQVYEGEKKTITVDWNDLRSIKAAEKEKARLENAGWKLIKTIGGLTTSKLVYEKK